MGCIPSKEVTRSLSFQHKLNRNFQRTSESIPAWEELLNSRDAIANDQLLASVYSTESTDELIDREDCSAKSDVETDENDEIVSGENPLPNDAVGTNDFGRLSRSKSCQMFEDPQIHEKLSENKFDLREKYTRGSRSFHTVEEYDALLKRIYMSTGRDIGDQNVQTSKSKNVDYKNSSNINEGPLEDTSSSFSSMVKTDDHQGTANETGWKRKAVARGLKSLDLSPVEFPAVARLRQWFNAEAQVYSPGTYVTPKFGSYNMKLNPVRREEDGNDAIAFSPEVVAAFEERMQQIEADEESILSYVDGYLNANNETANQTEADQSK